jgi:mannose-6-phosphate isomerase-like protein (cupin superfamily)
MTVRLSLNDPETFEVAGNTFRVLDDGTATDNRIGLVECRLSPGWVGPPQHIHRENDETFYILSGAVTFTTGSDTLLARPGQLVTVRRGEPHTFANADRHAPATLLGTVAPADSINYYRALADLRPGQDGRLDPADVIALMSQYATEPYRPVPALREPVAVSG